MRLLIGAAAVITACVAALGVMYYLEDPFMKRSLPNPFPQSHASLLGS